MEGAKHRDEEPVIASLRAASIRVSERSGSPARSQDGRGPPVGYVPCLSARKGIGYPVAFIEGRRTMVCWPQSRSYANLLGCLLDIDDDDEEA